MPKYKLIFHFQGRFKETFIKEGAATVEQTRDNLVRILSETEFIAFDEANHTYNKAALIRFDVIPIREDVKEVEEPVKHIQV